MKLTREQYRELYKKLPKEIFDFVYSNETSKKIYTLCSKHKLHMDDAGVVHDIVMDTAMGIIATKNMESEIIKELKLNPLDASQLVREIDSEVLSPIKETMVNTYKHSNPFKPQTLQHIDETDEVDESQLDRNNLLAEIENPEKSVIRKATVTETISVEKISTPSSNKMVKEEALQTNEPTINGTIKSARERMLNLFKDDKLSNVVTMNAHLQGVQETPVETIDEVKPLVTQNNVGTAPNVKIEVNKTEYIAQQKEDGKKEVSNTNIEKTPKTDPYRESI